MKSKFVSHKGISLRLSARDYTRGTYFITIVTNGRAQVLSQVVDGRVQLTEAGRIVDEEWRATETKRINVRLDRFVIMPDHFQAIIHLRPTQATSERSKNTTMAPDSLGAILGRFK